MSGLLIIFVSIIVLFALFVIAQTIAGARVCALCAGVSITGFALLLLYWVGTFSEPLLIAPLLGASVVGAYYLVEKKTKERLHVFRLPFFLTLLFAAYFLLGVTDSLLNILIVLALLWIFFGIGYACRAHPRMKTIVDRIIACCKNW